MTPTLRSTGKPTAGRAAAVLLFCIRTAGCRFPVNSIVNRTPKIMSGALCFTGTQVPVKNLFDYLEGSSSLEEFLEDFPSVSRARAVAVLEAARESLVADLPAD